MGQPPGDQTRHPAVFWSRIVGHARRKLYRLQGRHGQKQGGALADNQLKKEHLGKFANEDQMPSRLRHYLLSHVDNRKDGVINELQNILKDDHRTKLAYLCHPSVHRITKLRREGSFCGYRNIQMLISHIILTTCPESLAFPHGVPNIFQLQDQIEAAWDNGHNTRGRRETGGIKGTRKFIGTQEAEALFCNLQIKCRAKRFQDSNENSALDQIADEIESYFADSCPADTSIKIQSTMLPPIYFQQPGHSLTVIGLEKTVDNERNLLVFNPGYRYKHTTRSYGPLSQRQRHVILEPYRLPLHNLRKHSEFELL